MRLQMLGDRTLRGGGVILIVSVIAWAPDDQPTDEHIKAVVDEFEKTAWAGLEPDRYAWTAVLHREEGGSAHVRVLAARCDLEAGRSLNMSSLAVTFDSDLVTLTTESITRFSATARVGLPLTDNLGVRLDGKHAQGAASGSRKPPTATRKRRSRRRRPAWRW